MQLSIQECKQTCKNVLKRTTMIHVREINQHVTIHTLTTMNPMVTPQISHDDITTIMNKMMKMQQEYGMLV